VRRISPTGRISPSWATDATSDPLRLKTRPSANPRAPEADGECWSYSIHSSARKGRWNHMLWSSDAGEMFGDEITCPCGTRLTPRSVRSLA
jgi:hypothetical protein